MNLGFETETIEFKKTTGELRESIVSITSMLNKHGYGTVYYGVLDNGKIKGQEIGNRTLREISQAIANYIKPQIIPNITLELLDNKNVIKVVVNGYDKPYSALMVNTIFARLMRIEKCRPINCVFLCVTLKRMMR